jgi:hypothetical protein
MMIVIIIIITTIVTMIMIMMMTMELQLTATIIPTVIPTTTRSPPRPSPNLNLMTLPHVPQGDPSPPPAPPSTPLGASPPLVAWIRFARASQAARAALREDGRYNDNNNHQLCSESHNEERKVIHRIPPQESSRHQTTRATVHLAHTDSA